VDAHFVADGRAAGADPVLRFDELEGRRADIEIGPENEREHEIGQPGDEREQPRIATARHKENPQRAAKRQKGADRANGPALHHAGLAENMNQVISAATPTSMTKA